VDPPHRDRGVAKALLDAAAAEYAACGLGQLRATAAVADALERGALEQAGFRPAAVTYLRPIRKPRRSRAKVAPDGPGPSP
jgi:ribosomal protein S18 acetylase RimI-like enzyme